MDLTLQDREEFQSRGLLRLKRLIPVRRTKLAKDAIVAELVRLGARVDGKWHRSRFPHQLRHQSQFDAVLPAGLPKYLNELAGHRLFPAQQHPQVLLTPPQGTTWTLPHLGWHLDVGPAIQNDVSGIQVFALLDTVEPRGGGTLAITGSHRLHRRQSGAVLNAHQVLKTDPSYSALYSPNPSDRQRFFKSQMVCGVVVQVVEMCGDAGDVYLMDMRTVHAAAPNAAKNPRMMLTSRHLKS